METLARDAAATGEGEKATRERSTIDFPYNSLDDAITVAKAVHKLGGNECRLESLAAELGHETVNSGGFRQRLSGAHTFGLTSLAQGVVTLSSLGQRIVTPDQERTARVEAFLQVELYRKIYEEFKTTALPPNPGLEEKMVSLGVAKKQKEKARQAFQRSAKEAGFFAYGNSRLVRPEAGGAPVHRPAESQQIRTDLKGGGGTGGSGGSGGGSTHPLIEGLIKALPPQATLWPIEARKKWLQAAAMNFDYVYNGEAGEETKSIKVSVE